MKKRLLVQDKTQVTMLVMWLIEIYLNQLGVLKEQGDDMDERYDVVQEEFRKFLNQPRVKVAYVCYVIECECVKMTLFLNYVFLCMSI